MARKDVNLKTAPRKQVVEVEKTGSWGQVEWRHKLECGHIESRKRRATTQVLACPQCVLADQQQKRFAELAEVADDDELRDQLGSQLAVSEKSVAQIKAALVSKFGLPDDAVEVIVDDDSGALVVSYAVVVLTLDEIRRIIA